MRRIARYLMSLLLIMVAATVYAASEGSGGGGGWGPGGAYGRMYDPAKVQTVTGKVLAVEKFKPRKGMGTGIHLKLKTDQGVIPVHLGPSWYIDKLDTKIKKGDTVEVKGSRVTFNGKPAIIAAEVKKGDKVLKLRDDAGIPAWRGQRQGL